MLCIIIYLVTFENQIAVVPLVSLKSQGREKLWRWWYHFQCFRSHLTMKLLWTHHPTVSMVYPCRFFRFSFLAGASWTCFGQELGACSKLLEFCVVSLDIGYWLCMAWIVILPQLQSLPCSVLFSVLFPSVPFCLVALCSLRTFMPIHSRFWIIQILLWKICGENKNSVYEMLYAPNK